MHGEADLPHHIAHLFILQVRFVYNQRSFHKLFSEGKNVLQILVQALNLTLMQLYLEVHQRYFVGYYIRYCIEVTIGQCFKVRFKPFGVGNLHWKRFSLKCLLVQQVNETTNCLSIVSGPYNFFYFVLVHEINSFYCVDFFDYVFLYWVWRNFISKAIGTSKRAEKQVTLYSFDRFPRIILLLNF